MRLLLAGLIAAAAVTGPAPAPAATPTPGRVVVVGVPGLRWVDAGPELRRLAERSAVGSLSVRSADPVTGREDGWVTLAAGNRASADRDNDDLGFDTEVGALGTALRAAGKRTTGLTDGVPGATGAEPVRTGDADVVVVEVTTDAGIGAVAAALRPQDTLLLVGVSDRAGGPPELHVALASGPAYPRGRLVSASTRRAGFVQLIDVAPTVLRLTGTPEPASMSGRPWRQVGGRHDDEIARMVDAALAADAHRRYVPPFFTILVGLQLGLYLLAWLALRRRLPVRRATYYAAIAFAAVPVSTYLAQVVPWWRHPLGYLFLAVAAWDAVVTTVALRGPWRRASLGPPGAIAGITALVLGIDLLTGARLQLSSLSGYSPIVAGRFAGVGNVAFALFSTGAILGTAALCVRRSPRFRAVAVGIVGTAAVVIDGSPLWGSDFGGVLALVPGFAVLGMLLLGVRPSWRRLALAGISAVALVVLFAVLDHARPPDSRTHLGRFVEQVLDGGAGTVIERKARANLRLLTHSVLTLIVPFATAFLGFVLLRPWGGLRRAFERVPPLRAGLLATLTTGVVGFFANDSGVAIPALALTLAVPFALAASLASAETDDT